MFTEGDEAQITTAMCLRTELILPEKRVIILLTYNFQTNPSRDCYGSKRHMSIFTATFFSSEKKTPL